MRGEQIVEEAAASTTCRLESTHVDGMRFQTVRSVFPSRNPVSLSFDTKVGDVMVPRKS
jgi:hypothetical protein